MWRPPDEILWNASTALCGWSSWCGDALALHGGALALRAGTLILYADTSSLHEGFSL